MSELVASDADRDRVAERLRADAGEGRLTAEELADLPAPPTRITFVPT